MNRIRRPAGRSHSAFSGSYSWVPARFHPARLLCAPIPGGLPAGERWLLSVSHRSSPRILPSAPCLFWMCLSLLEPGSRLRHRMAQAPPPGFRPSAHRSPWMCSNCPEPQRGHVTELVSPQRPATTQRHVPAAAGTSNPATVREAPATLGKQEFVHQDNHSGSLSVHSQPHLTRASHLQSATSLPVPRAPAHNPAKARCCHHVDNPPRQGHDVSSRAPRPATRALRAGGPNRNSDTPQQQQTRPSSRWRNQGGSGPGRGRGFHRDFAHSGAPGKAEKLHRVTNIVTGHATVVRHGY